MADDPRKVEHAFGGTWTRRKLAILGEYLNFYTRALQSVSFKLVYIDAFAGTGRCTIKVKGASETIAGSAAIALDSNPSFHELIFIEKKPRHVQALKSLLLEHPRGRRARIVEGTAVENLQAVLDAQNWRSTRGVMFLDPYGLQCDWRTVQQIASTQALDVFFLVSLSGIYRQATNNLRDADADKIESLGRFLGTGSWMDDLCAVQGGLFGPDERHRHADPYDVAAYVKRRLETVFPKVIDPVILHHEDRTGQKGAPLYALFFAVSNPSKTAVDLASRVSREIMSKLR